MQHHCGTYSRRRFLRTAGAGAAMLAAGVRAAEGLTVSVRNPLLRTPLALVIDDSCPVINLGWYWIKQRHEWRQRLHPGTEPSGWERLHDKLGSNDLREVKSIRDFRSGTFMVEGASTHIAFDLAEGSTELLATFA